MGHSCGACKKSKPKDAFHVRRKTGELSARCKECCDTTAQCGRCKTYKPASMEHFHFHEGKKTSVCNGCHAARPYISRQKPMVTKPGDTVVAPKFKKQYNERMQKVQKNIKPAPPRGQTPKDW